MGQRIDIDTSRINKILERIKDKNLRIRIFKQISKIIKDPEIGKPMRNTRKGTREVYIKPFRLS